MSLGGLTTSQALNKQVNRAEASGGVVSDIKIENFDIAYGNHVILSNADLNLVYGRRYGLVGRNGKGRQFHTLNSLVIKIGIGHQISKLLSIKCGDPLPFTCICVTGA